MNLIKNAGAVLLLFVLITTAISCQKELHGDGIDNNNTTNPTPTKACVNCDYLPVCDSSVYVYVDSTSSGVDSNRSVVRLLKDTLVGGVKYSGASTLGFFESGAYYNCDAQEYKVLFNANDLGLNADSLLGILLQGLPIPTGTLPKPGMVKATILKAGSATGTKWKDVLYSVNLVLVNIEVAMQSELIATSATRTIFTKTYNDVIQVKTTIAVNAGLAGNTNVGELVNYYAKGVGIIEARFSDDTGLQLVRKLYSRKTF